MGFGASNSVHQKGADAMKNRIWVLLAAMAAFSGSLFAAEFASGKRVSFDESSGRVIMEWVTINASE